MSDLVKQKTGPVLTLAAAKAIGDAAAAEGAKSGWKIAVAVVDAGANLLYFARHEEASLGSINGATYKAETAMTFTRTTKAMADSGRTHITPRFRHALPVEGGIPHRRRRDHGDRGHRGGRYHHRGLGRRLRPRRAPRPGVTTTGV